MTLFQASEAISSLVNRTQCFYELIAVTKQHAAKGQSEVLRVSHAADNAA